MGALISFVNLKKWAFVKFLLDIKLLRPCQPAGRD